MMKIIATNHKVITFLGFKIIDIWEDFFERQILVKPDYTNNEINTTDYNIKDSENDN